MQTELFMYTANAIIPVFAVIFIGIILNRLGFFTQKTKDEIVKLVFYVGTPCLIFKSTASADFFTTFDAKFIGFTVVMILVLIAVVIAICSFIKDRAKKAAVIQIAYRSNFSIAGLPVAISIMDEAGVGLTAVTLSFVVMVYNISAVAILSYYCGKGKGIKSMLVGMAKNPLLIASAAGLLYSLTGFAIPPVVKGTLDILGDIASSMGLLIIGATITIGGLKNDKGYIILSVLLRNLFAPLFILTAGYLAGFRGDSMLVLAVMSSTPAAVNCFAMAKQMGADAEISAFGVSFTSIVSIFSVFASVYILKALGIA